MFCIKWNIRWTTNAVRLVVVIVFGLTLQTSIAQADAKPYDLTNCYSGTLTYLYKTKELAIFAIDSKGIAVSNLEDKVFDNCSFHSAQIIQILNGKWKRSGHTKFMDPDGDYFFVEISGEKAAVVKFLYGTGKWKGITGSGKFERLARGKAIEPGTFQGCVRNAGTFELPK